MAKTKITGASKATKKQMKAYIRAVNPGVPQSVIDMITLYLSEGKAEGIRGDIAFAQSCLETGNFTFKGSAVTLDQNNFAGIGVTQNGMKGNSWATAQLGIRAQIQHLKAYASTQKLKNKCVDPRYAYVEKGCAPYVEWLGIQENPKRKGWAAGKNYGAKILDILDKILGMKKEGDMRIKTKYISNNNSYAGQVPKYIAIHNTGNFSAGAGALAHASAQYNGNFKGYSAHVFVDDKEAYQAMPYDRGAWQVGVNYGGRLFGTINNWNCIGIEMCVQAGYNYEKAFQNTVQVCKQLMKQFGIPADRVVQHYDVCAKNCPSEIRARNDWGRFKTLITENKTGTEENYMFEMKPVKKGEVGNHVLLVQEILLSREFKGKDGKPLKLDKHCDVNTVYAIKQYQKAREKVNPGICGGVDGVAGPKTLKDMIAL